MTLAFACLFAAALLPIACTGIAKAGAFRRGPGGFDNRDPRGWLARQTGYRARADAAQQNSWEALVVFVAGLFAAHQLGAPQARVDALALVFVAARLAYVAAYVADRHALRSVVWLVGFVASLALFFAASW